MSNKISYADCITSLVPVASWTISGNDYLSLGIQNSGVFERPTH